MQFTTTSPQKTTPKTPFFSKTPSKNDLPPQKQKGQKIDGPAIAEPPF
jgi:hypothetical protein